ncbi:MAG TPA: hypothetical protein VM680_08200 [Verrucomicrobiae bacterium]|nr:hypothetical protein [Verrucomicrobiae bacterium]
MENTGEREEEKKELKEKPAKIPRKKRKTEPEVTIAPTQPGGGLDVTVG